MRVALVGGRGSLFVETGGRQLHPREDCGEVKDYLKKREEKCSLEKTYVK